MSSELQVFVQCVRHPTFRLSFSYCVMSSFGCHSRGISQIRFSNLWIINPTTGTAVDNKNFWKIMKEFGYAVCNDYGHALTNSYTSMVNDELVTAVPKAFELISANVGLSTNRRISGVTTIFGSGISSLYGTRSPYYTKDFFVWLAQNKGFELIQTPEYRNPNSESCVQTWVAQSPK